MDIHNCIYDELRVFLCLVSVYLLIYYYYYHYYYYCLDCNFTQSLVTALDLYFKLFHVTYSRCNRTEVS